MKKVTHVLAVALAAAAVFAMSPAGHALVQQYPSLTAISSMVSVLALYFNPKNPSPPAA